MSEIKHVCEEITEENLNAKGVGALADRPNKPSSYGTSGLSAEELKKWFDGLAILLTEQLNRVRAAFASDEATEMIKLPDGYAGKTTLKEALDYIFSGNITKHLSIAKAPGENTDPQGAYDYLAEMISSIRESLYALAMYSVALRIDPATLTLLVQLKNENGEILSQSATKIPTEGMKLNVTKQELYPLQYIAEEAERAKGYTKGGAIDDAIRRLWKAIENCVVAEENGTDFTLLYGIGAKGKTPQMVSISNNAEPGSVPYRNTSNGSFGIAIHDISEYTDRQVLPKKTIVDYINARFAAL